MDGISHYTSEEADSRVIRHLLNISQQSEFDNIVVQTIDTEVFLLLVAFFPRIREQCNSTIYCKFGLSSNACFYNIN